MENEPVVTPLEETPIIEAPPEIPELRYEYQPRDAAGRPMGGKQVIIYRTPEELTQKLTAQNEELVRKLREVTREQRLGIKPNENIPDDAERFDGLVEFKPRELSPDERFQISQDLNDPEKFVDARDRLLESAVGVNPKKLTDTLNEQQLYIMQLRARDNYIAFTQAKQEYADIADNRELMTNWMFKNRLAPTVKNFNYAYSSLKEAGLLSEAPAVQQEPTPTPVVATVETEPNPQVPVVDPSRIAEGQPPQAKRQSHVPSGLNDRTSSSNGVSPQGSASDGTTMTLAEIDKLSADQFKRMHQNPKFRAHIETLEVAAAKERQKRGQAV
jgi:hypothetical protein